jgi:ribosomal protein S18 acetylase RimI-like enzyme
MADSVTGPISVEPLDPKDASQAAAFYQSVLAPHFRADEVDTEESFAEDLRSGHTVALAARTAGRAIVGGAVTDWFDRSRVLLLSYLAVVQGHRSTGAGSRLMAAVSGAGSAALDPLLLVAEVDDPRCYRSDPAIGDPWARLRFYERLGGRTLALPYVQPSLGPGRSRVPHMLLMVLGGTLAAPGTPRVGGETVELFLREYYERCEGPVQSGDAQVQGLLAACSKPGGLALLPAGDLPDPG